MSSLMIFYFVVIGIIISKKQMNKTGISYTKLLSKKLNYQHVLNGGTDFLATIIELLRFLKRKIHNNHITNILYLYNSKTQDLNGLKSLNMCPFS